MKVYINGWEFNYGGGFDWYFEKEIAELAFKKEKKNVKEFVKDKWTAFLLEYDTKKIDSDEITEEIDLILPELIDKKLYKKKM